MGATGPVDRALAAAGTALGLRRAWERTVLRAVVRPLHGTPRPRRRDLERKRRRLQEALDAPLTHDDRAGSEAALADFLALEAAGWKGRAGTALASNPRDRAFFVDVMAAFHGRGRVRLMALNGGSRTVAMACELLDGDSVFGFKMAYDVNEDGDLAMYDSCSDPDAKVVNEMYGDRRAIVSFIAVPPAIARPFRSGATAALALRRRFPPAPVRPSTG